ncbi:MAG TPA: hypothetical protein VGK50_05885 [Coriobacteriia bacterium]
MSDDWGDIEDDTRMGRRAAAATSRSSSSDRDGLSRNQRFIITLAASAALMLVIGVAIGFALGRATAAKQEPKTAEVATATPEPTVTPAAVSTVSAEVTVPVAPPPAPVVATEPLKAPRQISPDDGARINADSTTLKWSKVSDPIGGSVTYAFEIQTRVSGKWGTSQVITGLKTTSYKARVLSSTRRWRVWAVDVNGKAGTKSGWSTYAHTAATTKSKTTTSTAH